MSGKPEPESTGASANDDDVVWRDLVARLEAMESSGTGGDPSNLVSPGADEDQAGDLAAGELPAQDSEFSAFDPFGLSQVSRKPEPEPQAGPRDYGENSGADTFEPEEPPSLANAEPALVLAWLGAVGAPIGLLLAAIFWRGAPLMAVLGIIAIFVAGAGYLMFRLPDQPRDSSDDDGAVL